MKWFDNLKLAYKLALSFGVCLILSLLAGVVALNKLSFQNDNTNSIVNGPLAEVGYLGDLRNDTKQYRIYQLRAYLMTDQAELATDLQDIAKRAGTIDADLDNYEKHATAADDKENLQELRKNWAAYRAFDAPIVKSIEAHDFKTGAIIMNGPSKTAFDGATEQLRKMDKWNTSNSQALSANSASAYSSGRLLVIVLLSIALLVGVATATSVTKSITAVVGDIASRIESLNNICIANLLAAIENLAKGKLDSTIVIGSKPIKIHGRDEFGVLSEAINGMIGKVQASVTGFDRGQKALKALIDHTHETVIQSVDQLDKNALSPLCDGISALADGDLTRKIDAHIEKMEVDEASDLGKLAIAFNKVGARVEQALENYNRSRESLGNLIGQASGAAENITASAAELATGNEDLSSRTSEQASSLEETAASMEEMTGTVKQNAENARHANDVAKQAREVAQSGGVIVQNAVKAMGEVNVATKRVTDIVSVIDEIAFQTNLLALNAAVEAARVGEQGRGFAVVAAEVRSLAGRSATAAKEIKALVEQAGEKVEDGTDLVNKSGTQLEEIVASVNKVAEIVSEIAAASQEQSVGIEQVNKAVTQMDEITQQNAALVEEATASSQAMSQQALELQILVRQFKVDSTPVLRLTTTEPPAQTPKRANDRKPAVRTGSSGAEKVGTWSRNGRKQSAGMEEY